MEREQAKRSVSRTPSSSDSESDTGTETETETDTVSEPDLCSNFEEPESEPEPLEIRGCGSLLALHTASLKQNGKQSGEQGSVKPSKADQMRNKDDHACDEEEDEMVNLSKAFKRSSTRISSDAFHSACRWC